LRWTNLEFDRHAIATIEERAGAQATVARGAQMMHTTTIQTTAHARD
jgi:hypothetical protein